MLLVELQGPDRPQAGRVSLRTRGAQTTGDSPAGKGRMGLGLDSCYLLPSALLRSDALESCLGMVGALRAGVCASGLLELCSGVFPLEVGTFFHFK